VNNPGFGVETYPLVPEPVVEAAGPRECPSCGRPTESGWRFCPYCESSLRRRGISGRRRRQRLDDDALQDNRGVNVGLLVLGIFLVVGVLLFSFTGGIGLILEQRDVWSVLAIGGTLLVLFVGGLFAIGVSSRNQGSMSVTLVIGNLATGAVILCMVLFALCIGVLNTCLQKTHFR
jgi:hypothetical protein